MIGSCTFAVNKQPDTAFRIVGFELVNGDDFGHVY